MRLIIFDAMRLKTHRGTGIEDAPDTFVFRDANDDEIFRTVRLVEDAPNSLDIQGDVQGLLDAAEPGTIFRFVQFTAAEDLDELITLYNDTYGKLADTLAVAKAIALDRPSRTMVSMSVWKDLDTLQSFLDHEDFVKAHGRVMGYLSRPSIAETLRREPPT